MLETLLAPIYIWFTGLKAPTNKLQTLLGYLSSRLYTISYRLWMHEAGHTIILIILTIIF